MTFLANPQGYSPAQFKAFVATLKWRGWKPKFIVLHNTAEPNLAQWQHDNTGKDYEHRRVVNLNSYYKNDEGWHSGPHLFISSNLIWDACDLAADGVHASCYNHESLGVEMVGDYANRGFRQRRRRQVRDHAVAALAILHQALGLDPETLRFHKECLADHHDCPGKNVDKADMIARVKAAMKAPVAASKTPALAAHVEAVAAGAAVVAKSNCRARPTMSKPRRSINSGSPTGFRPRKPAACSPRRTPKARSIPRRSATTDRLSESINGTRLAWMPSATAAASICRNCRRWTTSSRRRCGS